MLAQQQIEHTKSNDSNNSVYNARAYLVDAEYRKPCCIQHIHQRRQYIAQFIVKRAPIGAADQIAPVPADDIALLQQSLA